MRPILRLSRGARVDLSRRPAENWCLKLVPWPSRTAGLGPLTYRARTCSDASGVVDSSPATPGEVSRIAARGAKRPSGDADPALSRWTSCSSARRYSAGCCFVPDCERVRVNGGTAHTVLQGRPRGHRVIRPARVFVPSLPGDPESADSRLARLSRSRVLVLCGLDALALGGFQDLLIE